MLDQTFGPFLTWLQTHGLRIFFLLAGTWLLTYLFNKSLARLEQRIEAAGNQTLPGRQRRARTLVGIIRSLGLVSIILIATLLILPEFGLDVAPFIAGAGIVGLALSLGAQSIVKDLIGGFFILLEEQFYVGDVVRIGEISGTVERMTIRATYLRDLEGRLHLIPNGEIRIVSNLGLTQLVLQRRLPTVARQ